MSSYLVQEDGFQIDLEDGTGALLLEDEDNFARVSQIPVEVVVKGDASARVSQFPIEVVIQNTVEIVHFIWIDWQVHN